RINGWADDAPTCSASVSLSWPRSPRHRPKGCRITTNSTGRVWVTAPSGYSKDCTRDGNSGWRSTGQRPAKRFSLGDLGDHFLNGGGAERMNALRRHDEGAGTADHIVAVIVLEPAGRIGVIGIPGQRRFAQDDEPVDGNPLGNRF